MAMIAPNAYADPVADTAGTGADSATVLAAASRLASADASGVLHDGRIVISNHRQLAAIGTGTPVTDGDANPDTFGTGRTVTGADGAVPTYSLDADYELASTISLPSDAAWSLPDGFSGTFTAGEDAPATGLYDMAGDVVYIHNRYQLAMLSRDDADDQPVMSQDNVAATFGMGQPVTDMDGGIVTYGSANYAIAADFTTATPQGDAGQITAVSEDTDDTDSTDSAKPVDGDGSLDGRDYVGQTVKTIGGTTYILIGNEQQLRAIGSGKKVNNPVLEGLQTCRHDGFIQKWVDNDPSTYSITYAGDADLSSGTTLRDGGAPSSYEGTSSCSVWNDGGTRTKRYTLDGDGSVTGDVAGVDTGLTYAADADYIIFRDIKLSDADWTPLAFTGTMTGAKAEGQGALWDENGVRADTANATISNVTVSQTGELDTTSQLGIGFFSTLRSGTTLTSDGVGSAGHASVSSLDLTVVSIDNKSTQAKDNKTLIDGLLEGVGSLLTGLYDGLRHLLPILRLPDLNGFLGGLLDIYATDPTSFATGAFAGRIIGDVTVTDCHVTDATVTNKAGVTGGFAGYVSGETEYDFLSNVAGALVKFLSELLNSIPLLGAGDLITVLLGNNIINAGKLLPSGYASPTITGSSVSLKDGSTIGNTGNDYAGGFTGVAEGALISRSTVSGDAITVKAANHAGGFTGTARDATVQGTLGLDNLVSLEAWSTKTHTAVYDSSVQATNLTVAAATAYAGGFAGSIANSYAINDRTTVSAGLDVSSVDGQAGGFAGAASIGWGLDLGADENGKTSLLSGVSDLLVGLLKGDKEGDPGPLLSLVGIGSSVLLGVQVEAGTGVVAVNGGDNAGGLIGVGHGAVLASTLSTDPDGQDGATYWQTRIPENLRQRLLSDGDATPAGRDAKATGLDSVRASGTNAGGIAGSIDFANGAGLLNETLGVLAAAALAPVVAHTTVTGAADGMSVTAGGDRAAGGIALIVGGDVHDTTVSNLAAVSAADHAAGFAGATGTGGLADAGGVDLLGLGVVKISGLLGLGEYLQTTIRTVTVEGAANGMTVTATAGGDDPGTPAATAGGFIAEASASKVEDAHVKRLKSVNASDTDGIAGGFVGESTTSGLAEVADEDSILNLVKIDGLLGAVTYLLPTYTNTDVTFVEKDSSVTADIAGGFAGDMQAGTVDDSGKMDDPYAVYNVDTVTGSTYAGGFAGRIRSGALADAGKGLSILGGHNGLIDVTGLLNLINAYVPAVKAAGVKSSEQGLAVSAAKTSDSDATAGSAGGFAGYASGAQISDSDVTRLRHTTVTDPEDLTGSDASPYSDPRESSYAVLAGRYAGGYVGRLDIGSAASVGDSLSVLDLLDIDNIVQALNVVVSTIEHSDVYGDAAGYAVYASGKDRTGSAGGYAGAVTGAHLQDANAHHFSHVIGRVAAGGYVGELEPGDAAHLLGDASILNGLGVSTNGLLSAVQTFIPTVRNSYTEAVPCGGIVRAQGKSDETTLRGMAGGYVGHNEGGSIWGDNTDSWKNKEYTGEKHTAEARRIRAVTGAEFAGGFDGLMEAADTAKTGGLSLLDGLVKTGNALGVLQAVYPTEETTQTTGPLRGLDPDTWNAWVKKVGQYGGYGEELAVKGPVRDQEALDKLLDGYAYGYDVTAFRAAYETGANTSRGGNAGGYVGLMSAGTITDAHAVDVMHVRAMQAAGGFAGLMEPGSAAKLGSVRLLDLDIDLNGLLTTPQVFVPVVKSSSVSGYRAGMRVTATGDPEQKRSDDVGYAGGYVGLGIGAQLWGEKGRVDTPDGRGVNVTNLRTVDGLNAVGGFAGELRAGTAVSADTDAVSDGLLQGLLDKLVQDKKYERLLNVLQATVPTVRRASVDADDEAWGYTVGGAYSSKTETGTTVRYPRAAGGFVGEARTAVVGGLNDDATNPALNATVRHVRGVEASDYAGGFVGNATTGSVADVSGGDDKTNTGILGGLLNLGDVSALDAFRTYWYSSRVEGVADGLQVVAHGTTNGENLRGYAGGFAGMLKDSGIHDASLTGLNSVTGVMAAGGFIGHAGKGSVADLGASVAEDDEDHSLLALTAGVADIWGSNVTGSTVTGVTAGYTVHAGMTSTKNMSDDLYAAGGFIGMGDLAQVEGCTSEALKKVTGDQVAGGFIGRTSMGRLVDLDVDSPLVEAVVAIVGVLVKALCLDDTNLIKLPNLIPGLAGLEILDGNDLLYVNLLGLKIQVALDRDDMNVVHVGIGDATIDLNVDEKGNILNSDKKGSIHVALVKANRTRVQSSQVTGVTDGYDVFAGGSGQDTDATDPYGIAGGFVGLNNEGKFLGDTMTYADAIKGTATNREASDPDDPTHSDKDTDGYVGAFSGHTTLNSTFDFNTLESIEGADAVWDFATRSNTTYENTYTVYRGNTHPDAESTAETDGGKTIAVGAVDEGTGLMSYTVTHLADPIHETADWDGAMRVDGGDATPLDVTSPHEGTDCTGKLTLMLDTMVADNNGGLTPEPSDGQDPCGDDGCPTISLTVRKVWDDGGSPTRPGTLTYRLYMSYVDESGTHYLPASDDGIPVDKTGKPTATSTDEVWVLERTMTKQSNASQWSDTWRDVIDGLPVGFADENGTFHYYTYRVDEVPIDGYITSVDYETREKVATITNRTSEPLPDTGGIGWRIPALFGLLLIGVGLPWTRRIRRPKGRHAV